METRAKMTSPKMIHFNLICYLVKRQIVHLLVVGVVSSSVHLLYLLYVNMVIYILSFNIEGLISYLSILYITYPTGWRDISS